MHPLFHPGIIILLLQCAGQFAFGQDLVLDSRLDPLDPPGLVTEIPLVGSDDVDAAGVFEVLGRDTVLGSVLSAAPGNFYSYLKPLGPEENEDRVLLFVDVVYHLQSSYSFREGSREVLIGAGIRLKINAKIRPSVSLHSWESVMKGIRKGRVKGTLTMEAVGLEDPKLSRQLPAPQPLNRKTLEAALQLAEMLTPLYATRPSTRLPAAVLASRYSRAGQQVQEALPKGIPIGVIGQQIQQQKSH